jgi:ribonucleotide monophosphatase NagD (HAD superfamily)
LFIATNLDTSFPSVGGKIFPGGGSIVAPLIVSTGRKPIVIGKPESWLLDDMVEKHNLDRSRCIMVGDRLDTDILFGQKGHLKTLLVFTGTFFQFPIFAF